MKIITLCLLVGTGLFLSPGGLAAEPPGIADQVRAFGKSTKSIILNERERVQIGEGFAELVDIRGSSGHEGAVREYLRKLLKFTARPMKLHNGNTNAPLNLVLEIPATVGFEERPGILLNAHIDTIPQSNPDKMRFDTANGVFYHEEENDPGVKSSFGGDDRAGVAMIVEAIRILHQRVWTKNVGHRRIVLLFTAQEEIGMQGAKYLSRFEPRVFDNIEISLAIDGPIDLRSRYPKHAYIAVLSPSDESRAPYKNVLASLTEFCKATNREFGVTRLGLGMGDFAYFPEAANAGLHLRSPVQGWHTRERVRFQDLVNHVELLTYLLVAWDHESPFNIVGKQPDHQTSRQ
jgi:putative aminopeptidase FrvX